MSKMKYYKHAETLFLQDNLSIDEICKNLNVSRRTLFYWRTKYEWARKKAEKLANKEGFSKELQSFTEKLMAKLTMDMQNKKPVNQSEYYTLTNLLKYLPELVKIEFKQQTEAQNQPANSQKILLNKLKKSSLG